MATNKLKKSRKLKDKGFATTRFSKRQLAIFAILFSLIGGYFIYSSFAATSPAACTIYVSPGGGGNGSSLSSPTTLINGINLTVPGSVVCLLGGTYNHTSNITNFRSGSSASWITYRNYDSNVPIVFYNSTNSLSGGQFQLSGTNNWDGQHHIIFDGITFDGNNKIGGAIFLKNGVHHITMRNLTIKNEGSTGLALNAVDYVRAENNQIWHGGYNAGWSSGISLWYGGDSPVFGGSTAWYDGYAGFHNVIANNIISGWYDSGVDCSKYTSSCPTDGNGIIIDASVQSQQSLPPVLIVGNVVYENGGRGIQDRGGYNNVWIINNTLYANGTDTRKTFPNLMAAHAGDDHWINNIVMGGSSTDYLYWIDTSSVSGTKNIYYQGRNQSVSNTGLFLNGAAVNPLLVNPHVPPSYTTATQPWQLGDSLKLQSTSPAINAGQDPKTAAGMNLTLLEVLDDYLNTDTAGNARYSGAIDIGAYEYVSTTSSNNIWAGDIEEGTLADWYYPSTSATGNYGGGEYNSDSGDTVASTEMSHTGSWSNKMSLSTGIGGTRLFRWQELRTNRQLSQSTWMYIPQNYTLTGDPNNGKYWILYEFKSSTADKLHNDPFWYVNAYNRSNGTMGAQLSWGFQSQLAGPHANETGWRNYGDVTIPIGRWFKIESNITQSKDFDGAISVKLDDQILANLTNVRTGWSNCTYNSWCVDQGWAVTNYSDSIAQTPTIIYADDSSIDIPSDSAPKQGDLNNDSSVNIFDLSILLTDYGKDKTAAANQACDINNDNAINIFDLSILLSKYGT